jgi:hypothetical protein
VFDEEAMEQDEARCGRFPWRKGHKLVWRPLTMMTDILESQAVQATAFQLFDTILNARLRSYERLTIYYSGQRCEDNIEKEETTASGT